MYLFFVYALHKRYITTAFRFQLIFYFSNSTWRDYFSSNFSKIIIYPKNVFFITSEAVWLIINIFDRVSSKKIENWQCSIKSRLWKTTILEPSDLVISVSITQQCAQAHQLVFLILLRSWLISELTSESSSFSLFEIKSFLGWEENS